MNAQFEMRRVMESHLMLAHLKMLGNIDESDHVVGMASWLLKHVFKLSKRDRSRYSLTQSPSHSLPN